MKTIIAPTDFSDVSLNAVYYAADMASTVNANLLVLHSTEAPFSRAGISSAAGYDEINTGEKLESLKKDILARLNNKIQVSAKQVSGIIEDELIKICEQKLPLAVIMATHGKTFRELFFVSSITVYLSKNLKYPLLVVPAGMKFKPINKILLTTDLENIYELPIEKITKVVTAFNAMLDIAYVYNNEDKFDVMVGRINELSNYLIHLNPQVHLIKGNNVHKAIVDFTRSNKNDLILTFPKKHFFFHKSESRQLIFYSSAAVMAIQ